MAVSFKVPASPKKNIFVIDKFMGVDLTNTGANVDETRSPNAENMIRYVPGKVRKRMGYDVPVEFSQGKDVNRAVETTDDYVDCEWDANNEETYTIYDDHIDKVYIYLKVKAVGSYELHVDAVDNTYVYGTFSGTEEEPYESSRINFGYDMSAHGGFARIKIKKLSSGDNDYCSVAKLRICHDTNAADRDEWINMSWKPAPEDKGNVFILTPSTDPVYGKHTLKTGNKQGDFVTNVNRALGTSDTYRTYDQEIICTLGEVIPKGKTVHISFDYQVASGQYACIFAGYDPVYNYYIDNFALLSGSGTYSADYTAAHDTYYFSIGQGSTLTPADIKNFKVTYASTRRHPKIGGQRSVSAAYIRRREIIRL